jgi:hypothetical protein
MLKTGVSGRDPALRGPGECSHTGPDAARPHRRVPWPTVRYRFLNTLLKMGRDILRSRDSETGFAEALQTWADPGCAALAIRNTPDSTGCLTMPFK